MIRGKIQWQSLEFAGEIVEFLSEQYGVQELEPFILCIGIYAEPHFESIGCFKSWWKLDNLVFTGKSPAVLSKTKTGMEAVLQYRVELNHKP